MIHIPCSASNSLRMSFLILLIFFSVFDLLGGRSSIDGGRDALVNTLKEGEADFKGTDESYKGGSAKNLSIDSKRKRTE